MVSGIIKGKAPLNFKPASSNDYFEDMVNAEFNKD